MASVIPGYEYDIFISYRHNDNRSGWVTGFVEALKDELASTIKQPISVYFDTNPHDGLLETHNVDKSLEGKLKCLIFIPVISQTYCDLKSFAWQHEFKPFIKMVNEDQYGQDIRLSNGNFASRIFPVKIHDLDAEDLSILENELGGNLRSLDLIFRSPGVNRPLKPDDDRGENNNHTSYRDQINKLANGVKEIIRGFTLKTGDQSKPGSVPADGAVFITGDDSNKKSIAVLPFTDMSPGHDQEYLGDGLAAELLTILSQVKALKVAGRTSSFSFKNKNIELTAIGKALNVDNILEGSIQKADNRVRIKVQLINAEDGFQIWSQKYEHEMSDIFALQDEICENISEQLKIALLDRTRKETEKRPTKNIKAYELFLKGDYYCKKYSEKGFERAGEYFKEAIELDPGYADAWWYLGFVNYEMHGWLYLQKERLELAVHCASKAVEMDATNPYAHFLRALIHFTSDYDWSKTKAEIDLGNKYTRTQFPTFSFSLEPWYRAMLYGDFDYAVGRLESGVSYDPLNFYYQFHLAQIYLYGVRDYKKTISVLNSILELGFPEKPAMRPMCLAYLFEGQYVLAEEYARKDYVLSDGKGYGAAHLIICLASSGKTGEAQQLYTRIRETMPLSEFPYFLHTKANIYLGNTDEAFSYLDKAVTEKNYWLFTLKYSPEWDLLRTDSRFERILERMNFPK